MSLFEWVMIGVTTAFNVAVGVATYRQLRQVKKMRKDLETVLDKELEAGRATEGWRRNVLNP